MESFKKVAKKVHPDKGGATEDADRQREKERKRKGEREREDNKEENRTEKRRREGRGRKGKARRRGAGNHRHPSLVPLVRPHARASSRRDDLSQHTAAGQKFLQFYPNVFFLKFVLASQSKSSNDVFNAVVL